MLNIESAAAYSAGGDVRVLEPNPFLDDSYIPDVLLPQQPARVELDLETLLGLELPTSAAFDGTDEPYGPHVPFVMGGRILLGAEAVQIVAPMVLDGKDADIADRVGLMLGGLKEDLADFAAGFPDGSVLAEDDDAKLIRKLAVQQETFLLIAHGREAELEQAKLAFVSRMHYAIESQGLPLTRVQLKSRMEEASLGFQDPLNGPIERLAVCDLEQRQVLVNIDRHPDDIKADVFHELLHLVSGVQLSGTVPAKNRIGLELPFRKRLWLNEAVTDLLANILLSPNGFEWDFASSEVPLLYATSGYEAMDAHTAMAQSRGLQYRIEKLAALDATKGVSTGVLLGAYFAQNNDHSIGDKRAASHAERELQRVLKASNGVESVKQLREIDANFAEASRVILNADQYDRAQRIAWDMAQRTSQPSHQAEQTRRIQKIRQHHYRQQIRDARQWVDSKK